MTTTINCATGTLAPYVPSAAAPWDKRRAMHLFRRLGFGETPATIAIALEQNPADLVDFLIDQAVALPPDPTPDWSDWDINDYENFGEQYPEQIIEQISLWLQSMMQNSLREKMTLFWHNHFVTKFDTYNCPSWMNDYLRTLQTHAFGNFKEMTVAIGTTPAMLVFLNGVQSTVVEPNENYARELFELFTLGQDNGYTQDDIVNTARALTGWNGFTVLCAPINYLPIAHDNGLKNIFGQIGNWDYDDVHDILFTERAQEIATHICGKLYRNFVHPEVDEAIVAGLAQTFLDNNFDLVPVYRQLFKSEHFFDEYNISTVTKSPLDVLIGYLKEANIPYNQEAIDIVGYLADDLGQTLLSPPDVAGWPGNRAWIDTNTMTGRWQSIDYFTFITFQNAPSTLVDLAKELTDNSNDVNEIAAVLVDHFIPNGLNQMEAYDRATTVLKWEIPQNYFDDGSWNLDWDTVPVQMAFLLQYIARLPEFQLG